MATAVEQYLEGPNFIPLQQYADGSVGVLETGSLDKIEDCLDHIELAVGFVMVEGGKAAEDVSLAVAKLWWKNNRDDCDQMFDVPAYVHDLMHNEVYSDISESRYNANAQRMHEQSFVRGL